MIKIKPDKRNRNKHTQDGLELLYKSIDKVGIIESYTVSNDGVIISGNARHEKISAKFTKEPIVIETDGTEPIIIKRTDIESNTKIFEPFTGSGSTMVAAHQLKRKCYGMEIDPKYADVIVKRMLKLDETLTVKRNGIDCTNEFKE